MSEESKETAGPVAVTVENFPRAETHRYFAAAAGLGGFGKMHHHREPMPVGDQDAGRASRDTLASAGILDLDAGPAAVTLPEAGDRFLSLILINEDHYVVSTHYGAGTYPVLRSSVGTRYVMVGVRALVDPQVPGDLEAVHALQDAIVVDQPAGPGSLELPDWDPVSRRKVRDALIVLGETLPDLARAFGARTEVDPVRHLIASAVAWGGNPDRHTTVPPRPEILDGAWTFPDAEPV